MINLQCTNNANKFHLSRSKQNVKSVKSKPLRATSTPSASLSADESLQQLADVYSYVSMQKTALGRGLVLKEPVRQQAIVSVPIQHALVLTDEPLSGISVFGDRCQAAWEKEHGEMPELLRDFMQGGLHGCMDHALHHLKACIVSFAHLAHASTQCACGHAAC